MLPITQKFCVYADSNHLKYRILKENVDDHDIIETIEKGGTLSGMSLPEGALLFFCPDESVTINYDCAQIPDEKQGAATLFANKLNKRARFVRFLYDPEFRCLRAATDVFVGDPATSTVAGVKICEMLDLMRDVVKEIFPDIAKMLHGDRRSVSASDVMGDIDRLIRSKLE